MSHQKLIYDGLWRCLCPTIDRQTLLRAANSQTLLRPVRQRTQPTRTITSVATRPRRPYSTGAYGAAVDTSQARFHNGSFDTSIEHSSWEAPWQDNLLAATPPTEDILKQTSVDNITSALLALREGWRFHGKDVDVHSRIIQLVRHLIQTREQPLKPFFYECMMDAMADPQGSIKGIRSLFKDMELQGMQTTATMCQSALKALMIHPDYNLRQEVLATMRSLWFAIETTGQQHVVIGMLRDGQYELAYDALMKMIDDGLRVDLWVFDVFILVFGNIRFMEEMLQLLHRRQALQDSDGVFYNLLYFALDVCSQNFHYGGTIYAWNKLVKDLRVPPPDGLLENVLATAAKQGDADLAIQALDMLSQRSRFQAYHYEAAAETFCSCQDLAGALGILGIMAKNGVVISHRNTRMLYLLLKENPGLVEEAVAVLAKLQWEQTIPPAAVASIIEAIAELRGSETTMEICSELQEMDDEKMHPAILRHLICNSKTPELRQSLFASYKRSLADEDDPVPTSDVYNKFIPICVAAEEWDLAFSLAEQASEPNSVKVEWSNMKWFEPLLKDAIRREDARILQIVDKLSANADEVTAQKVQRMLQYSRSRRPASPRKTELDGAS